jgi:hypothetical protein
MATVTSTNPGNFVVPLSAIIDQLQGKLSAADLNALLLAVTGQKKNELRPGDLISADLFNQMLSDLENLNIRVSKLEITGVSTTTIHIYRIDGPTPIRVRSRVTVVGDNFSVPATRNGIAVNTKQVTPIDSASTATQLVFDMPDPGIGQTGQRVTLTVTNADSQTAPFQFQLEPALIIPSGTLAVSYMNPPGGATFAAGSYDFVFKLVADVDQDASVLVNAQSSALDWPAVLIDPPTGASLKNPIALARSTGTHFESSFVVRLTVPGTGSPSTVLNIGATEQTSGTQVNPAPTQSFNMALNQAIPAPESRLALSLLGTSTNVTFSGGVAIFSPNTLGQINFQLAVSNLGVAGGVVTTFNYAVAIDGSAASNWSKGPLTQGSLPVTGASGKGTTSLQIQPPGTASSAALLFTVTGTPSVGNAVNVTFRIPLQVK